MGGGSSKDEQSHHTSHAQLPPNANNQQQVVNPQPKQNDFKTMLHQKTYVPKGVNNHYNEVGFEGKNSEQGKGQFGLEESNIFGSWDSRFHHKDKIRLRIHILTIEPSYEIKNLSKKQSDHQAEMSWEYEYGKKLDKALLRFYLVEDGGYNLTFLLNEEGVCLEGDETIWNIISPFRSQGQSEKVGTFLCQRNYQSNQEQINGLEQNHIDSQLFYKWGQKPISDHDSMRRLLKKKQMLENIKSDKGFQYSETAKYFDFNNKWAFSVLIQQRRNSFKSWIVEALEEMGDKNKLMGNTLLNDVETRKAMYIEEMRRKRDLIRQCNKKIQK